MRGNSEEEISDKMEEDGTTNEEMNCAAETNAKIKEETSVAQKLEVKVTLFIVHAHSAIHATIMNNQDENMESIDVGIQIHNILIHAFKRLWKRVNILTCSPPQIKKKASFYSVKYLGKIYKKACESVETIVSDVANEYELRFKKFVPRTEKRDNWYGLAINIMDHLHGFELRIREMNTDHSHVSVIREQGEEVQVPLAEYGLELRHRNILEGITFSPGKRRRMVQSLGPMTALIGLIEEQDPARVQDWVVADRAFGMIPKANGILENLREKKVSEIQHMIRHLADICMLTLPRRDCVIFPPPNVFSRIFKQSEHNFDNETFTREELIESFDFKHHGAQVFYKIMSDTKWKICGDYSELQARQIVYHATFGTYVRDFAILGKITNETNWESKKHFQKCFGTSEVDETREIEFFPIKQKFWSITETKISFSVNSQYACVPVFGGYRTQDMSDLFQFFSYPNEGDFEGFALHFKNYYDDLVKKYAIDGKQQDTGKTKWYKTDVTPSYKGTESLDFCRPSQFFFDT